MIGLMLVCLLVTQYFVQRLVLFIGYLEGMELPETRIFRWGNPRRTVKAWTSPKSAESGKYYVYFHGNAEQARSSAMFHALYDHLVSNGWNIVMPEYPGFQPADGERRTIPPSPQETLDDCAATVERFCDLTHPNLKLVFHGRSLGGALAAQLAQKYPVKGLILESTFPNLACVVQNFTGLRLPKWLLCHELDTYRCLRSLPRRCQTLKLHGLHDELVPVMDAVQMEDVVVLPCGHNDMHMVPQYAMYLTTFITSLDS